ncbi:hypothetical protein CC2G_013610 [Coprinopsis cinerea AmutBmut pab1-1]|nr:hypothetical protein CC2G_013610 [Coprinopsis cinerea AmutBmut pab1-1]
MAKHRLRVLAGPSLEQMRPISVNDSHPHKISSDLFEGEVVANIKGFTNGEGEVIDSEYFEREDRQGVTWSIQVQGRFLVPYSADDILFGNTFDRPLKLPWGTGAVLRFMNYIDPTLEHDLQSPTKPWALSPLIATMPHFAHHRVRTDDGQEHDENRFPPKASLTDNTSQLYLACNDVGSPSSEDSSGSASPSSSSGGLSPSPTASSASLSTPHSVRVEPPTSALGTAASGANGKLRTGLRKAFKSKSRRRQQLQNEMSFESASQRRTYFSSPEKRQKVMFGPLDVITTDFCYGFINFSPSLSLQLPGGLSFDLMRYWDGQPVRFVCCERRQPDSADPWGRLFWCVSIEMVEEEGSVDGSNGTGPSPVDSDID